MAHRTLEPEAHKPLFAMVAQTNLFPIVFIAISLLLCAYIYSPIIQTNRQPDTASIIPAKQKTPVPSESDSGSQVRYILLWTDPDLSPLNFLGHGFKAFTTNKCEYTNCYVTHDKTLLPSLTNYDAIVFNGRHLPADLPKLRSEKQKYVYANMESSHYYPICGRRFDNFFNWTWTYKLNSDSRWGYITAYNLSGHAVAPKIDMKWPEMDPVPVRNEIQVLLESKKIAAAWFVSNCKSKSRREHIAKQIAKELDRHGLSLHIYGRCGDHVCPRQKARECNNRLAKSYYFYLAFENSFSEDYVTEKVLTALRHDTVPVVFGAANYSRFLPPGSYLDAMELGPAVLAGRMAAIIEDHRHGDGSLYHDFFRWRNHYTFRETSEREDVCSKCRLLNDPVATSEVTIYGDMKTWWNSQFSRCPAG